MIQENEIRIGNWFYHKPDVWSYRNQDGKGGEFQWTYQDWYALHECTLALEAIEPVKATYKWIQEFTENQEEYLNCLTRKYDDGDIAKMGLIFIDDGSDFIHTIQMFSEQISDFEDDCHSTFINLFLRNSPKEVFKHTIQNLFYSLTGQELTKIEKG